MTANNASTPPDALPPEARAVLRQLAHELRTPLGAAATLAEMLQREAYGPLGHPKYLEYAASIVEGVTQALDVLAVTLEADRPDLQREPPVAEPTNTWAVVASCLQWVAPMAEAAVVTIDTRPPPTDVTLRTDAVRLRQVIVNLLVNAIKFTPDGGTVTAAVDAEVDGCIVLTVADNGIGIAAPLAQPPGQDAAASADAQRRGLGLTLVRQLAAECGATFALDSVRGTGTKATLRFPRERVVEA